MSEQQIAEIIVSDSGRYRAEIKRRSDGLLQVHLLRWTEEIVPDHGKVAEFWAPVRTAASITDDHARAVEIATELLRTHDSA